MALKYYLYKIPEKTVDSYLKFLGKIYG